MIACIVRMEIISDKPPNRTKPSPIAAHPLSFTLLLPCSAGVLFF
jgi:hypothetical protein